MICDKDNTAIVIKNVFSSLQDEISRVIFLSRLSYYLSEDERHLHDMLKMVDHMGDNDNQTLLDFLENTELHQREIILYGAGSFGGTLLTDFSEKQIRVSFFCDSDKSKQGKQNHGVYVISPEELVSNHLDAIVVVSTKLFFDEIFLYLAEIGFPSSQIYVLGNFNEAYFGERFLRPVENEVYIDTGVYDGYTIKRFMHFCGDRYKRIFGLEPDPNNWQKVEEWLVNGGVDERISLIQKGAWNCNAVLSFNSFDQDSSITETGVLKVEVAPVDELIEDEAVTLIKMDIEGSELKALEGAQNTIKKHKPRLAISVYHKPEDILEIPLYIQSLVPEYRFYLRHHNAIFTDTVFYAVL